MRSPSMVVKSRQIKATHSVYLILAKTAVRGKQVGISAGVCKLDSCLLWENQYIIDIFRHASCLQSLAILLGNRKHMIF